MYRENPFWDLPEHERDRLRREADAAEDAVANNDARILAQLEDDANHERSAGPPPVNDPDRDPWEPEAW